MPPATSPLPRLVIFDLDGTLVDTAPDLSAALNAALAEVGRPGIDPATVRHLVGHGARALIERGLVATGGGTDADVARALPAFLYYYAAHIADGSRPFPGTEAALDRLALAGVVLAICTNKPVGLADALLEALGWRSRFAAVLGGDSLDVRKPDARHVAATAAGAGVPLTDAVFVGDTALDVAAARAAGVPVIVVAFGFADAPVATLGADAVIGHFDDLDDVLSRLSPSREPSR